MQGLLLLYVASPGGDMFLVQKGQIDREGKLSLMVIFL